MRQFDTQYLSREVRCRAHCDGFNTDWNGVQNQAGVFRFNGGRSSRQYQQHGQLSVGIVVFWHEAGVPLIQHMKIVKSLFITLQYYSYF